MRFLFLTDTQFRGTTPRWRTDDFPTAMERKIREVGELARQYGVTAVLHGGDMWDAPAPALSVTARFLGVWREAFGNVPTYVVQGNHDEVGYNPQLVSRTVLGLGASLGLYRILGEEPVLFEEDGLTVQVTGTPYHYDIDKRDPVLDYVPQVVRADRAIHIVHGMLVREPIAPGAPYTPISAIWDRTPADLTLAGHNHFGFPLTEHEGRLFYNPGALARMTGDPRDRERTVQVVLIEVTRHGVDVRDVPLRSVARADEIANAAVVEEDPEEQEREAGLRTFIESLRQLGQSPGENLMAMLDRLAAEKAVEPEVLREAKERLSALYREAQEKGEVVLI